MQQARMQLSFWYMLSSERVYKKLMSNYLQLKKNRFRKPKKEKEKEKRVTSHKVEYVGGRRAASSKSRCMFWDESHALTFPTPCPKPAI